MSAVLSLLVRADAAQAEAALKAIKSETTATGKAVAEAGKKAAVADAQIDKLTAAHLQAKTAADGQALAARSAAAANVNVASTSGLAAGQVGNLTAQFNDIGVMMAAGQNPLQLALQQGTQITQVIGPLGAAGAVKALTTAFVGMINPISLVTIGTIAAGAAIVGWLTKSEEGAKSLSERIEAGAESLDRYKTASDGTRTSSSALAEEFGSVTTALRTTLDLMQEISRSEARASIDEVTASLATMLQTAGDGDRRAELAKFFDVNIGLAFTKEAREARTQARALTAEFVNGQSAIIDANGDLEKQAAAVKRVLDAATLLADASGSRSSEQAKVIRNLGDQYLQMQRLIALQEKSADLTAAELLAVGRANLARAEQAAQASSRTRIRTKNAQEEAAAEDRSLKALLIRTEAAISGSEAYAGTLEALRDQAALQEAIARHGADSVEVAELRAEAERDAQVELINALDVSEDLKAEMLAIYDSGAEFADLNLSGGVTGAANEAVRLAEWLGISLDTARNLAALGPQGTPGPDYDGLGSGYVSSGRGGDPRTQGGTFFDRQTADAANFLATYKPPKANRRGRGASEAERQREAVTDLISALENELAILRATDTVQQEMLRNRDKLTAATEAERDQVEQLILTRERERAALDANQEAYDFAKQGLGSFFSELDGSIEGTIAALGNLASKILEAVAAAYLLGDGPLAGVLGKAGTGGAIGGFLAGAFPGVKRADGGPIYGAGGPRDDKVPVWASPGEYMVNATATARHRGLLERINAGMDIPGFRDGGLVGGGSGGGRFGSVGDLIIEDHTPSANRFERKESVDSAGRRQTRLVMSEMVADGLTAPGGSGPRTMRTEFGLKKRRPRR